MSQEPAHTDEYNIFADVSRTGLSDVKILFTKARANIEIVSAEKNANDTCGIHAIEEKDKIKTVKPNISKEI